jgi:hypothetical protein
MTQVTIQQTDIKLNCSWLIFLVCYWTMLSFPRYQFHDWNNIRDIFRMFAESHILAWMYLQNDRCLRVRQRTGIDWAASAILQQAVWDHQLYCKCIQLQYNESVRLLNYQVVKRASHFLPPTATTEHFEMCVFTFTFNIYIITALLSSSYKMYVHYINLEFNFLFSPNSSGLTWNYFFANEGMILLFTHLSIFSMHN